MDTLKIVFWNIHNTAQPCLLSELIKEEDVGILILTESSHINVGNFVKNLENYALYEGLSKNKLCIIAKDNIEFSNILTKNRYTLAECKWNNLRFNLGAVHLQSQNVEQSNEREETIRNLKNDLATYENITDKTMIIGDFNVQPYSNEMIAFNYFNAVVYKDLIKNEITTFENEQYKRFYNPTLTLISEKNKVYGTHYYDNRNTLFWEFLDQCIIRKSLLKNFIKVGIMHKIRNNSLLKNKKPNNEISDHLPIYIILKGEQNGKRRKKSMA